MALIGSRRERLITSAEKLVARGRLRSAIKEYRKVLKDAPEDTNTLNRVGDLHARLNQVPEAVDIFREIAGLYERDGFSVKAIAIYKKVLRLDPSQLDIHGTLGDLYRRQGLVIEARSQYSVLAEDQRSRRDLDGAGLLHRKMLELEPSGFGNMVVLVDLLAQDGEMDEARDGYRFMADRMIHHGDIEGAESVFISALESEVGDEEFAAKAVQQLRGKGQGDAAERVLAAAVARFPDAAEVAELVGMEAETAPRIETVAAAETEPLAATDGTEKEETVAAPDEAESAPVEETPVVSTTQEGVDFELDLEQMESKIVEDEVGAATASRITQAPATELSPAATVVGAELVESATAELLAEVGVFIKYGLEDKAVERLEAILEEHPGDAGTLDLLSRLHLAKARHADTARLATELARRTQEANAGEIWRQLMPELVAAGYRVDDAEVRPPAKRREVAEEVVPSVPPPPGESIEANVAWLEELARETRPSEPDGLFESEDEFFDLAAELEDELDTGADLAVAGEGEASARPSLDRIVETFRQKIGESLSESDFDTHFNLGIAYREMGLLDESITEFQLAARDHRYLVDCCSLLGTSFLEKGFPDLAVKWYRRGLDAPSTEASESLGLLYELGSLYQSIGDVPGAQESYSRIREVNPGYRDVTARLRALEPMSES